MTSSTNPYSARTSDSLADLLRKLAEQPRFFSPAERAELLVVAAERLDDLLVAAERLELLDDPARCVKCEQLVGEPGDDDE